MIFLHFLNLIKIRPNMDFGGAGDLAQYTLSLKESRERFKRKDQSKR